MAEQVFRTERDALGTHRVPADAYYGIQTARAIENYPISGLRPPADFLTAMALIKRAAAQANGELSLVPRPVADAIARAADEMVGGALRDQCVVDLYQAGAGTSLHMNVNEVLANRAAERLGAPRGVYDLVHPNDHVNRGQSTNDVFPAATRLALLLGLRSFSREIPGVGRRTGGIDAARGLARSLQMVAEREAPVAKTGRTHLQDAVPMSVGQEFGGYAACVERAADGLAHAAEGLRELNLGATAVGTGLNAPRAFTERCYELLNAATSLDLVPAANLFRVSQSMGDILAVSGAVRRLAVEVGKVASDLRLLASGPRAGIAEVVLPAVQPGSSIMPGKVNPSIPEMVNQVCYQVLGCDHTVAAACDAGQLELNVMMPVIAWNALHEVGILREALRVFATRCIDGLTVDTDRTTSLLNRSTAAATALTPHLGYAATAVLVKDALALDRPLIELVVERGLMSEDDARRTLAAASGRDPRPREPGP